MKVGIEWRKPDPYSLSYLIISRILDIRLGRAQIVLYWHFRGGA